MILRDRGSIEYIYNFIRRFLCKQIAGEIIFSYIPFLILELPNMHYEHNKKSTFFYTKDALNICFKIKYYCFCGVLFKRPIARPNSMPAICAVLSILGSSPPNAKPISTKIIIKYRSKPSAARFVLMQ